MVPPATPAALVVRSPVDALGWSLEGLRAPGMATDLVWEVATRLPFFVPRTGLLVLDWQCVEDGQDLLRVCPRLDLHAQSWLTIPVGAVRPTGASIHVERAGGERQLALQMPDRRGRAGARVPLATGLMRMSMQAHDEHVRFLPVLLRSDLSQDRYGDVSLHLHSLDLATLVAKGALDAPTRKRLVAHIAERVLGLMSLPGAGLARDVPMIIDAGDYG